MNWHRLEDLNSPTEGILDHFSDGEYCVAIKDHVSKELGPVKHLMVHRLDDQEIKGWDVLQRIKNQLVGPETWAYEVYPAESSLVNAGRTRHLWCMFPLPFGYRFRATDWLDPNLYQPQKVV